MSIIRSLLCATMMALIFISSAYGDELTVSVSEGSGANSITSTSNFGAAANNAVEQAITLTPKEDTAQNHMYVEGDYSTSRSVSGRNGGYCYSGFDVTGSGAKSYYDFWADGNYYATLAEWLTTANANSINAYGYAYSDDGSARGSLYATSDYGRAQASYYNYALATSSFAYDYQYVGSASGNYVSADTSASNYNWDDYAYNSFYVGGNSYYPAIIGNVAQYASSTYTYANAGTTSGNAWSYDGYVAQYASASDYWGDYSVNYLYSPGGMTWLTSSYQSDYAYASGYNRNTWTSGSAYIWGNPTYAYAYNYNAYTGLSYSDYDYYYGWNSLSQYAYNSYDYSGAVNFQY